MLIKTHLFSEYVYNLLKIISGSRKACGCNPWQKKASVFLRDKHDQNGTLQKHDTQRNNTQINAWHCYAECQLCSASYMLSVTYKPFMLSVTMLNVVMLSGIMLNVVALAVYLGTFKLERLQPCLPRIEWSEGENY
jgi:hypothetical protein